MTATFDYFREDTIAALSTPPGRGAIAVLRISGPAALSLTQALSPPLMKIPPKPRRATLVPIVLDGEILDEVLITFFPGPDSYTGEDVVEISCHGGQAIVRAILGGLYRWGARPAGPGEFTFRAVRNGKLDLIQAQAVGDLIEANTERFRRAAFSSYRGILQCKLLLIEEALIQIAVHLEASIEFPDDVSEEDDRIDIGEIQPLLEEILEIESTALRRRLLTEGFRYVLIGRPNVGKSCLFNRLVGRDRAIVSPHPGTTRDTIEATLEIQGIPVTFIDTAGLRNQPGEVEALGMERTREAMEESDALLLVTEAMTPLDSEEQEICDFPGKPVLVILNKMDLVFEPPKREGIPISALTGEGMDVLWEKLDELTTRLLPEASDEPEI
ncbi:MAG TPA: tRNA uridine-5-carboxymethylaminomethyl(34) synthesis GTPase MnmE, partial [bacterium]|nr:tRNA uridine-5-carboxymethylaminomethyl(34) synthesis GTPase MnmE [bacterium]